MKRDYFSHASKDAHHQPLDQQGGSCIALIDARFLVWLAQHNQTGPKQDALNRFDLAQFLTGALGHAGLDVSIKRIYWYAEEMKLWMSTAKLSEKFCRTIQMVASHC